MDSTIIYIGSAGTEDITFIVGKISKNQYVVFSPIKKSIAIDDSSLADFHSSNIIDIDLSITGPTDALNKTTGKIVNICVHAANIDSDEALKYMHQSSL